MPIRKSTQSCDPRLWAVFYELKDSGIFPHLSIPRSTRYTWCKRKPSEIIIHESFDKTKIELIAENEKLRKRFSICTAIIRLLKTVLLIADFRLDEHRLPAFKGQTPDEMFFGHAPDFEKRLAEERTKARERRIEFNRALSCDACQIGFNQLYSGNEREVLIELQN